MHILLAEDNEANRLLVRSLLEREGHTLEFAENGLIALIRCEDKKYDLILMDILMPVMDGVKTLRKLRRAKGLNMQTPVFALTGYSSPADKKRYRQVGFDIVLSKPLKPNVLSQAWESFLKGDAALPVEQKLESLTEFSKIALINTAMIGQLLETASTYDVSFIAGRFWDSTKAFITVMHENLSRAMQGQMDALTALRRAAHGIKGSAANLGLTRLSAIAASLQNSPPDKIGALILALTNTIEPTRKALDITILDESERLKTDFAAVHSDGADAPIRSNQILSSRLKSQSPHKKSTAEARQQQARVP